MQSVGNIRELFANENEAPLSKDQIVRKKLEKMGVTGENLFSESFKLSTTALVEERLKEKVYESYQDIAEVNFGVADVTAYDNRSLRLKLLFVDIGETNTAIYAFMKMAGLVPKFGKIHTALAVGNKIVEWNDSSICYPRECTSSKAILAVDLATLQGEKVDSGIKALADVIVKWNTTREYSMMNGNCQNFVDECLTALGIEPTFKGLFGEYVANVRKTGSCTIQLRLSEELQEEFGEQFMKELGFENNCISFERHDELDRFTWKILDRFNETFGDDGIKTGPERIEPHHKELYAMLKAFDRGFWLRMRKGDPNQCPHNHGNMEPRKCPWRDPIETHTNWTPSSRQPKFAISQNSGNTSTAPKQAQKGGACNLQ